MFLNVGLELCVFDFIRMLDENISNKWLVVIFFFSTIFHLGLDFIFAKELKILGSDYNFYYKKWLFVAYCILILSSIIFGLYILFR